MLILRRRQVAQGPPRVRGRQVLVSVDTHPARGWCFQADPCQHPPRQNVDLA